MALKQKQKDFKNVSGGTAIGGAPIYANDLVRLQQNAKADFISTFEALRTKLPAMLTYDGVGLSKQFESGLILSGLEYDNTDPNNPVVSEGYILSGGEVIYYPGGVINTGGNPNPTLLYLWKGAPSYDSRVFADGGNKEILVSYGVNIELGSIGAPGPQMNGSTAIISTDEVVVLTIGAVTDQTVRYGESYFSIRAGLELQTVGQEVNKNVFTDVINLGSGVTVNANRGGKMVSRVIDGGRTEIRGAVDKTFSGGALATPLFKVSSRDLVSISGEVPLPITYFDASTGNWGVHHAEIVNNGDVTVRPFSATWPTGPVTFYFDCIILGNFNAPIYTYNSKFLDVTP